MRKLNFSPQLLWVSPSQTKEINDMESVQPMENGDNFSVSFQSFVLSVNDDGIQILDPKNPPASLGGGLGGSSPPHRSENTPKMPLIRATLAKIFR